MDLSSIKKYSPVLIISTSLALGLLLPQIGSFWQPYTTVILGFIMFLTALNINPTILLAATRNIRVIALALILTFIIPPILSLPGQFFFSPIQYAAIVLALSAPAAISSVFWSDIFHGNTPLALVISIFTNLLALITLPITMFVAAGIMTPIDVTAIILNLIYMIVIPISAAQALKKLFSKASKHIINKSLPVQHALMFLLIWGGVSPGAIIIRANPQDFFFFNIFFLLVFTIIFSGAYFLGKRFGRANAIALGVVSSYKNSILAIVIGSLLFGPQALPPLIANLVAQNIFLIPAKAAIGNR